jgi:hypothetical protein
VRAGEAQRKRRWKKKKIEDKSDTTMAIQEQEAGVQLLGR